MKDLVENDIVSYDVCSYEDSLLVVGPRLAPESRSTVEAPTLMALGMVTDLVFPQPNMRGQNVIDIARPIFGAPCISLRQKIENTLKQLGIAGEHFGIGVLFRGRNRVPVHALYAQHCRLGIEVDTFELSLKNGIPLDRVRVSCREVLVWEAALNPAFYEESP